VEGYVAISKETAIKAAIEVGEVDKKIFGLQADIADDVDFKAAANGPTGIADAAARKSGDAGVDVPHRQPARQVREEPIESVSQPPPHRGEPMVAS
jgi:hypothetical protein